MVKRGGGSEEAGSKLFDQHENLKFALTTTDPDFLLIAPRIWQPFLLCAINIMQTSRAEVAVLQDS
jgi:hypothetical protein